MLKLEPLTVVDYLPWSHVEAKIIHRLYDVLTGMLASPLGIILDLATLSSILWL